MQLPIYDCTLPNRNFVIPRYPFHVTSLFHNILGFPIQYSTYSIEKILNAAKKSILGLTMPFIFHVKMREKKKKCSTLFFIICLNSANCNHLDVCTIILITYKNLRLKRFKKKSWNYTSMTSQKIQLSTFSNSKVRLKISNRKYFFFPWNFFIEKIA